MGVTPTLYWWQFTQILVLYTGIITVICVFMRRYFPTQEPGSNNNYAPDNVEDPVDIDDDQEAPPDNYNFLGDIVNNAEKRVENKVADNIQLKPELTTQGIQMKVNLGGGMK